MKQLKTFLLLFAVTFSYLSVQAQDIHFSQFYMSPMNLNPALTGVMNSQVRVVGNYRNQWASVLKSNAFSTYSASYDQKIPVGRYDYFGIGGTFWGDKAGQLDFKTLTAKLSASYSKRMGGYRSKSHYLVVGAEAGIAQRSIDFTRAQWASQHDGEGGFAGGPSGEDFSSDNFIFPDFSAGLLWFTVFNERSSFYAGGAFSHLNRANQSFNPETDLPLYSKFTVHAGGEFMGGGKIGLVPGVVALFQGPSFELNAGTSLKFLLSNGRRGDNQSFQLGLWARLANRASPFDELAGTEPDVSIWADAIIVSTRFDYNNFGLGFSYDLNVSDLRGASNGNGAFEFSIIYNISGEEKRDVYCPNF